ncbi:hypothetical protein ABZX77_30530 [Streptomyces sp. NPDC004237]|uniref:hypothetical protein n=1 Tax=Streptomyces sp. NPDC004237 TaxID=3154455 RepID=UPI0033A574AF
MIPPIWESKLPAALDALVAIFTAAEGLQDVTIRDGASVSQARLTEVLSVGYTGEDDQMDAEAVVVTEGLGGSPDREQISIRCVAAVAPGSTDLPAARKRAYEIFGAAAEAIAENRTLRGVVMRAWISAHTLMQGQTDQGAQAAITFTVTGDCFTRR